MAKADLVAGTVLLIASLIGIFVIIPNQIDASSTDGMSPDLLPLILVFATGLFSLILVVTRLFGKTDGSPNPISRSDIRATLIIAACVAAAILLIQVAGLIVAGTLLIAGLAWIMGERRPLILAAISIVPVCAVTLLASTVLRISLP